MAFALWRFEMRDQRPFERSAVALFDASSTAQAAAWYSTHIKVEGAAPPAATVVHLYRAGCSCNRFTEPHLARIVASYRDRGVRFVSVRASTSKTADPGPPGLEPMQDAVSTSIPAWIDATPAALVFDAHGKLVYFGPYSDAAWCGASGGLVERVLDRTLAGKAPQPQPVYARGCYCNWK